jgi:hypothetical protein
MEQNIKNTTSKTIRCLLVVVMTLSCIGQRNHMFGQDIGSRGNFEMANKAADEFFEIYLKNQRSKNVFDDLISTKTIGGLKKTGFFEEFGFNPKLIKTLDDQTLLDMYRTIMDSYFIGTLYNEIVLKNSKNENDSMPDEVLEVYTKSQIGEQYLKKIKDENESDLPIINTRKDQIEYIKIVDQATSVLEKYLPNKPFDTLEFKKQYKDYCHDDRCNAFISNSGDEQFDITNGIPIYIVNKYPFTIHFIKEQNAMKILRFGIGN